jgi:putative peptide zinc metalloprotease protein
MTIKGMPAGILFFVFGAGCMMEISMGSRISLVSHTLREDRKGHYIVEVARTGDFFELPLPGADALIAMGQGETLESIEKKLVSKYPEEEINMVGFVKDLSEFGLVSAIDGMQVEAAPSEEARQAAPSWVIQKMAGFFFHKAAAFVYVILFGANLAMFAARPSLFPHYRDMFVFDSMVLNSICWLAVSMAIVLFHESGHMLAASSRGLSSRLTIGHRLFFVVFETDLTQVWKLRPRQRYFPYLAGICFDQLALFAVLSALLLGSGLSSELSGILHIAALTVVGSTLFQCLFFMKTDLYYVIENATGCYNLMENSRAWLGRFIPFIGKEGRAVVFESEERVIRTYGLFYLAGLGITAVLFVFFAIPQLIYALHKAALGMSEGPHSALFWDGVMFLLEMLVTCSLLIYSRQRGKREEQA